MWSKALDEGGGGIASDSFLNSVSNLFYFLPKYRRVVSDFNVAQNLTINYVWNIAAPHSFSGPAAWAARGWQLGGIFQMRSGLPITPVTGPSGGEYGEMRSLIVAASVERPSSYGPTWNRWVRKSRGAPGETCFCATASSI
jgi:hypothetical protein